MLKQLTQQIMLQLFDAYGVNKYRDATSGPIIYDNVPDYGVNKCRNVTRKTTGSGKYYCQLIHKTPVNTRLFPVSMNLNPEGIV